jgi:hypothetical protein
VSGRDPEREPSGGSVWPEAALLAGAFVLGTLLAELLGATNLGTALTFGTMALILAILAIMLRR